MDTKNIDRLFQEKLKDLEMSPNPAIWNSIEKSLVTKKKKRILFWWWSAGGSIAAVLLIGFFFSVNSEEIIKTPTIKNSITDTKKIKLETNSINQTKNSLNRKLRIHETTESEAIIALKKKPTINEDRKKNKDLNSNVVIQNHQKLAIKLNLEHQAERTIFGTLKKQIIQQKEKSIVKTPITTDKKSTKNNKIELEEVLKKEEVLAANNSWIIAPSISQLRPSSFSNKSSIDQSLDGATKKGNNGTSFGIKIAFQASEKWQIQSGIHSLQLGQTTQNIALNSNRQIASLNNLNFNAPMFSELASDPGYATENSEEFIPNNNSNLKETYGYIEIPLEVKYAILQSEKLEFHLVSGISTLFLTSNTLRVQDKNLSYAIGEASNLNPVDFSVNFGTDLEYHFSKKWFFNMAPMLKIQTNTFKNSSNKPYFFGVYTGLNYKL